MGVIMADIRLCQPSLLHYLISMSARSQPVYASIYKESKIKVARGAPNFFSSAYRTLPALAGMVVSIELVAAAAAAMFLPSKLVKKLEVL